MGGRLGVERGARRGADPAPRGRRDRAHHGPVSRRLLLFVDIDGVLNPYGPHCPPGFVEHDLFPGQKPVRVCALHGGWLHELSTPFQLV